MTKLSRSLLGREKTTDYLAPLSQILYLCLRERKDHWAISLLFRERKKHWLSRSPFRRERTTGWAISLTFGGKEGPLAELSRSPLGERKDHWLSYLAHLWGKGRTTDWGITPPFRERKDYWLSYRYLAPLWGEERCLTARIGEWGTEMLGPAGQLVTRSVIVTAPVAGCRYQYSHLILVCLTHRYYDGYTVLLRSPCPAAGQYIYQ